MPCSRHQVVFPALGYGMMVSCGLYSGLISGMWRCLRPAESASNDIDIVHGTITRVTIRDTADGQNPAGP